MHPNTRAHLEQALAGEALASLRYRLFADAAEDAGYEAVAELFEQIGKQERREHAREIAGLLGTVRSTRENLEAALEGEVAEHRRMYPGFAAEARIHGDFKAAERFQELGADEHRHAAQLRQALHDLDLAIPEPASPMG